jgi:hypothetical protein
VFPLSESPVSEQGSGTYVRPRNNGEYHQVNPIVITSRNLSEIIVM